MNSRKWSRPRSRLPWWGPMRLEVAVFLGLLTGGGFPTPVHGQETRTRSNIPRPGSGSWTEPAGRAVGEGGVVPLTLAGAMAMALETHPAVAQARAAERAALGL